MAFTPVAVFRVCLVALLPLALTLGAPRRAAAQPTAAAFGEAGENSKRPPAPTLCRPEEKIVFSCQVAGKAVKIASLCASRDLGEQKGKLAGTLEYRFGPAGKAELVYPGPGVDLRTAFDYSSYTRPMFSLNAFGFVNGGTRYVLFAEYDGEKDPEAETLRGVRVSPAAGGKKTTSLACVGQVVDRLFDLEDLGFADGP